MTYLLDLLVVVKEGVYPPAVRQAVMAYLPYSASTAPPALPQSVL